MTKRRSNTDDWLTASEIGNAEYCPYQLYLYKQGIRPDSSTQSRLRQGTQKHKQFNNSHQQSQSLAVVLLLVAVLIGGLWLLLR